MVLGMKTLGDRKVVRGVKTHPNSGNQVNTLTSPCSGSRHKRSRTIWDQVGLMAVSIRSIKLADRAQSTSRLSLISEQIWLVDLRVVHGD